MAPRAAHNLLINRRHFFGKAGVGATALTAMLNPQLFAAPTTGGVLGQPHVTPKAKRVIYLFQSGAPSQMDLFDYKPKMQAEFNKDLPERITMGQRKTGMTSGQKRFPVAPSVFKFAQHGKSGAWLSDLLPHHRKVADDLCFIKSMHTEAINHDPAITFFQTGHQIAGRPSFGSWLTYGLGSMNDNLPSFVAMASRGSGRPGGQPLYDRLWSSGFMPGKYSGVKFRGVGDPVVNLYDPKGIDRPLKRHMLDDLAKANELNYRKFGDPEIATRIEAYELAYRMQTSVPELIDFSDEPKHILDLYGPDVRRKGSYAYNCLMARRLAERDVRCIQLFHMGWDQHGSLPKQIRGQCRDTDQASAALVLDLKQRGMLDDTLVVWGGEFGRTIYSQGALTKTNYGRDHHPRCFTIWMAGGGIKAGHTHGQTDDYSYNIVTPEGQPTTDFADDAVHVHDLHATLLHQMGIDHKKLTYKFQGRHYRLTDVHGHLVKDVLA